MPRCDVQSCIFSHHQRNNETFYNVYCTSLYQVAYTARVYQATPLNFMFGNTTYNNKDALYPVCMKCEIMDYFLPNANQYAFCSRCNCVCSQSTNIDLRCAREHGIEGHRCSDPQCMLHIRT